MRERFRNSLQTKVFNTLQKEFCTAPLDDDFLEDNRKQRKLIKIPQLKNRETNITTLKKKWKKNVDCARAGSWLDVKIEPK